MRTLLPEQHNLPVITEVFEVTLIKSRLPVRPICQEQIGASEASPKGAAQGRAAQSWSPSQ